MSAARPEAATPPRVTGEAQPLRAYTVEQVAEILHVGRDKVYALLRTGELRSIKIGKSRRITASHITEFVSNLERGR